MGRLSDIPAVRVGYIRGIPVFLDLTFLAAAGTILFALVRRQFPGLIDYGIVFSLVTAGVFLSILTHELGHAFAARRFGLRADEIRIGGFYGLAFLSGTPWRRLDSILILLAGPIANALNAIVLMLIVGMPSLSSSFYLSDPMFASPIIDILVLRVSLEWLIYINLGMLIFNLLPAFPLDGGRIARLLLENVTSDAIAVRLVSGAGLVMGIWSVFGIARYPVMLLAAPMLVLANYAIWKGELAAPAD